MHMKFKGILCVSLWPFAGLEGSVNLMDGPPHRVVLEPEIVGAVAGLGKFKHFPLAVVGLACNNGKAIIIVEFQIFFIDLSHFLYGHDPFRCDDRFVKCIFDIIINRPFGNLWCKSGNKILAEIIMIKD